MVGLIGEIGSKAETGAQKGGQKSYGLWLCL